ncbi:MAG: hypothetical protein NTX06_11485, partial [Proteobacteria bacterium]|nr:hypothetical protein [Pseudomonadota bacterium]
KRFKEPENFVLLNQVLQFAHSALARPVFISVAHLSVCCRGLGDVQAAMAINQKPSGFPAGPLSGKARGVSSKSGPYSTAPKSPAEITRATDGPLSDTIR